MKKLVKVIDKEKGLNHSQFINDFFVVLDETLRLYCDWRLFLSIKI